MKKIRFLEDYRGKLTAEAYFLEGAVDIFGDDTADALIAAGRAVEVVAKKSAGAKNKMKPEAKSK